ncbi:MAG TPA: phytanoyl-CoA dioxygenase family protein [Pyrinomonadaceae bacterium]|jgi:Phytanoyl-CoA dioxygenase (PhyH).|nr:phytanoyl-CoA dioxygenase family protein [Pyrinomonadaceae bacterium]
MSNHINPLAPGVSVNSHDLPVSKTEADGLVEELTKNGIVVLPQLLSEQQLRGMQKAFEVKLRRLRWNNFDGYQRTEVFRHMVEDVLLLDQGFVDVALHPLVKQVIHGYIGDNVELTEAKGWKSLPTNRDFHGWHGDAWYDQDETTEIHKEIKLAMYLTDVKSGAFNFIKGSHRRQHPRPVKNYEISGEQKSQVIELTGPAGTAFMFDTSGIHRQGIPVLEPRQALFYNYHDPSVPLQKEDVDYYRYHPLLLNAAFLGELTEDDYRILGFGNKTNYIPAFERSLRPSAWYQSFTSLHAAQLRLKEFHVRISDRLRLLMKK